MPYRSIEATKRKCLKRIERLQERQKRLIDRIVYESDSLSEKKIEGIKSSIRKVEKMIRRKRDEIANGYRAPHKCLKRKRKRQQEAEGDGISQREYAALYAKACLYRGLAYGLAKKYDPSAKEMINSISHIDGKNV